MSLRTAIAELFKHAEENLEVSHGKLSSTRLWVLVGFAALLLWVTKGVLTEANLKMVFWVAITYTACNTVTKAVTIFVNARTKAILAAAFMKDGALDANETSVLVSVDTAAKAKKP